MKKIIVFIICTAVLFAVACNRTSSVKKSEAGTYYIGIAKIIIHPALDSIEQGIKDELAEQGFTSIRYNSQNANGEMSTASAIAGLFKNEQVDIAVGIATPTALALANQIHDRPVIFSAVSDPIGAGLRTTMEPEAGNLTGVSDMAPVRQEIILITELIPGIKTIGHIYTPAEANSVSMMKEAQKVCDELGIELILSTVTNTSEVKQAAIVMAPKVQAIYISNDNTVVAALPGVTEVATRQGIPVVSADPSSAEASGVAVAYGIDNYKTGRATGKIVARVLRGEKPSEIPVKMMTEPDELASYVNVDLANQLKLHIPDYLK